MNSPLPQGKYVTAKRHNDLIYTSGMTPRKNGVLIFKGLANSSTSIETYRSAVELATKNALDSAKILTLPHERIESILNLIVYIAAESGFTAHTQVANFASAYLQQEIGLEGVGCRTAIGVSSLPENAAVEIQLTVIAVSSQSEKKLL